MILSVSTKSHFIFHRNSTQTGVPSTENSTSGSKMLIS